MKQLQEFNKPETPAHQVWSQVFQDHRLLLQANTAWQNSWKFINKQNVCIYHQVDWKGNVIYMLLCAICKIKHVANSETPSNLRKEVKILTSLKHVIILLPNLLEQLRNTRTTSVETLNRKLRKSRNFWIKHHLILIKKLIKPMLCNPTDVRLFAFLKTWRQIINM